MTGIISQQYIQKPRIRTQILLGCIALICSIAIYFVLDAMVIHRPAYPIAVITSNIEQTSVTVSYLTQQPVQQCVLLFSWNTFSTNKQCEQQANKLHVLSFSGLRAGATYHIFMGSGIRWVGKAISPIGGLLFSSSYTPQRIPSFTLLKTSIEVNSTTLYLGRVLTRQKVAQGNAIVLVRDPNTQTMRSTQTNSAGNFALLLPNMDTASAIDVSVWSEKGYVKLTQPMAIIRQNPVSISVLPYE